LKEYIDWRAQLVGKNTSAQPEGTGTKKRYSPAECIMEPYIYKRSNPARITSYVERPNLYYEITYKRRFTRSTTPLGKK